MHEYAICSSILSAACAAAQQRNALAVRHVYVRLGEQAGVDPELLRTAFSLCRGRGIASQATLSIDWVPARWVCRACDLEAPPRDILCCRRCAGPLVLAAGDELLLDRVELECDPERPARSTTDGRA